MLGIVALSLCASARAADADKGETLLQLGLFQKEGEAWWTWQRIQRRGPDVARILTPSVVTLSAKQGSGVALRATLKNGGDANALCRRIIGAGFGCLAVQQTASDPVTPQPASKPAPQPVATQTEVVVAAAPSPAPVPASPAPAVPQVIPVSLPMAPPVSTPTTALPPSVVLDANPTDGIFFYNGEDASHMAELEKGARRRGRLGSVVPDTDLDIMPAVLTKKGWNLCALTFDDGPHHTVTRQILDIVNQEKIRVTYFPVGRVAARQGDLIRDFVAAGHEIGNHSLTHSDLRAMPAEAQRFEIAETNRILRGFGADPVLFRPPYGRYTLELLSITRKEHMSPVLWNVDTRDWKVRDPDKIVQHVKTDAGTGSVILLHSTYPSTANALPRVIATLRAKGCEFVTLSEWIASMRSIAAPYMVNAAEPVVSARAPIGAAPN